MWDPGSLQSLPEKCNEYPLSEMWRKTVFHFWEELLQVVPHALVQDVYDAEIITHWHDEQLVQYIWCFFWNVDFRSDESGFMMNVYISMVLCHCIAIVVFKRNVTHWHTNTLSPVFIRVEYVMNYHWDFVYLRRFCHFFCNSGLNSGLYLVHIEIEL